MGAAPVLKIQRLLVQLLATTKPAPTAIGVPASSTAVILMLSATLLPFASIRRRTPAHHQAVSTLIAILALIVAAKPTSVTAKVPAHYQSVEALPFAAQPIPAVRQRTAIGATTARPATPATAD